MGRGGKGYQALKALGLKQDPMITELAANPGEHYQATA
jgi:hypothetical protein